VIVRISRGADMAGVVRYLAGPGRANEHSEPHLVAGDGALLAWWDDTVLDRAAAVQIGAQLDEPRRYHGTEVAGGHVWHASLSLPAGEGQLPDERWARIAGEFVGEMGFTEASGKAGCRWVAVRHGLSKAGNDHVHLVVSLVRDDGTKASVWNDYRRAGAAVTGIERRHGLVVLEAREAGRGSRGVSGAELNKAVRLGVDEPARAVLARQVRAFAVGSVDEAQFVRRAREAGLLIRPRYAAGRADVVEGYSVAQRPGRGQRPVWFGGGSLDRDLTLPRLRAGWVDTPLSASAAVAEWSAAARHREPVGGRGDGSRTGGARAVVDLAAWTQAAREVAGLRERLIQVPVADTATWSAVAHDSAGVLAAWSQRLEPRPGPYAAASDQLARSAQTRASDAHPARRVDAPGRGTRRAAMLLLTASPGTPPDAGLELLMRQLRNTWKAVHDAHAATGQAQAAARVAAVAAAPFTAAAAARSAQGTEQVRAVLVAGDPAGAAVPGAGSPRPGSTGAGGGRRLTPTARGRQLQRGHDPGPATGGPPGVGAAAGADRQLPSPVPAPLPPRGPARPGRELGVDAEVAAATADRSSGPAAEFGRD